MIKSSQIVAFVGAIILIIILCFAPITKKENMDSKIKVAIEKVNSKNPMEGILMLKEIAKEYPNNTTPLFHLGMFSIQTNQFEKAINYFTNVLNIDSNKIEVHLHLGDVFLQI